MCHLPFSEKIPQGPSVDDPKINLTLFRRGGGGQFRVPPRRPRRQEKETRFEGNFLPLLWLLPLLLPFAAAELLELLLLLLVVVAVVVVYSATSSTFFSVPSHRRRCRF